MKNGDYIERKAAIEIAMQYCPDDDGVCSKADADLREMLDEIEAIPDADVAPVRHGRWLTKEYMYGDQDVGIGDMWIDRLAEQSDYYAYCSECGEDAGYNGSGSLILSDFCPSCGAEMDGDGE